MNNKTLCIVGASMPINHVPFVDPEVDIWGFNHHFFDSIPRFDLWFDFHKAKKIRLMSKYCEFLKANESRVLVADTKGFAETNFQRFPKEQVEEYFQHDYFSCTVSWLIGLAVIKGYENIILYGIDLCHDSEYAYQKPSVMRLIGYAEAKGIKIIVPDTSILFYNKLYWNC